MSSVFLIPAASSDSDDVLAAKVARLWDAAGLADAFRPRDLADTLASVARVVSRGGLFGIDLVPDVPKWREYRNRVQLRGKAGGAHLTLIESVAQQQHPYLGDPLPRGSEALTPYRVLAAPNIRALGLYLGSVFMIVTGAAWFVLRGIQQLFFKPVRAGSGRPAPTSS